MWFLKYLAIFVIWLVLLYMFMGFIAFIPYFFGLLYGAFMFPIEIINQVIYPVWRLPYIVWVAWISLILAFLCWGFVTKWSKK